MNFARAVRIARAARGLRQKQLAVKAGLDPSYVSLIEKGTRTPSLKVLETLAVALAVPFYVLVLLASNESELKGLEREGAETLANYLLAITAPSSGVE